MRFQLVLPCYNESRSLETIVVRAKTAAEQCGFTSKDFQLVLVENGSKDHSMEVLQKLLQTELGTWFRVVPVLENKGYGFGLWSGLKTCTADYVAWSHADQQCDPMDAFRGLKVLQASPEKMIVKGHRSGRDWKDRMVTTVFESLATILLFHKFSEINAQPKVFAKSLLSEIKDPPQDFAFDLYVLFQALRAGYKIETIPVLFPPRIHGMSNWSSNFLSRSKHVRNMIKYIWKLSRKERV